ncbi:MAG TPA: cold shock domain-containing protein [Bacteroidales bacterium]|jgi:cold shock CspA family protein|nr:cold shock domain-containing protein [Bacteroidales bacterium]OQB65051.1 MAG: Cold shock-like protein CspG [Bacteroidetes bacterium ADurb.Bin145]NMD04123.1 cold shock domain-containing protein [Bacteroidales bacterium]HOU03146.1 cold shock domain-containing protein [Bacteroidales bacterium]HQG64102.1 cold shock domain-containing protein [Bacteroidales bacterium]
MGRSQETSGKKEVRNKKEKKRKEKEQKRALKKISGKKRSFDEMIAYVDEFGKISSVPPDPDKKTVVDADSIELTVTRNSQEIVSDPVRKGIITFFNESKGFGFIRDIVSDEKVFVHVNNLTEPVKENDLVAFELEKGPRGLSAINVKLLKE